MSSNPAQPFSDGYSLPDSYKIIHENIGINDFESKTYDEQAIDLISLVKTMNTLLQNQKVLINTLNILFQNQEIIMRKNDEINELIKKVPIPIINNDTNREEEMHDRMRKCSTSSVSSDTSQEEEMHDRMKSSTLTSSSDTSEEEESDLPKMPFTNATEFLSFDNELRKNKILQKKFARKISVIGGSSFQKATRRIMKFLLTDELLCQKFTWTGIRKTIPMNNKKLPEIIFAVLHREPSYSNCTLNEVEKVVKMWLQQARTRLRLEEGRKALKALQNEQKPFQEKELLDYYLINLNGSS